MSKLPLVVTGATSGIGEVLADLLAHEGWPLILVGRDESSLERRRARLAEVASGAHQTVVADLGDPASVDRAFRKVARDHSALGGVFLNAGVLLPSLVYSPAGRELHFEVHVAASHRILRWLKPALVAGRGTVVASSSGARHMASTITVDTLVKPPRFVPMAGPYAASKQALVSLFSEWQSVWFAEGVRLTAVDLGPTRTPMAQSAGMPGWLKPWARWFASPEASARRLVDAFHRPSKSPRVRPVPGLLAWLESSA